MKPPGERSKMSEKADWVKCRCGMFHSNRVIPSDYWKKYKYTPRKATHNCGVVLRRGDDIFLVQTYNNYFGLPKGSVKNNREPFLRCALRELYEDTSKYNKPKEILIRLQYMNVTYIFFVFDVNPSFDINTKPVDDMEITSFGWMNINEIRSSRNVSKITQMVVERNIIKKK
jgi:ADP-ribose pyrophosphatase YjhB (NUDIX family)